MVFFFFVVLNPYAAAKRKYKKRLWRHFCVALRIMRIEYILSYTYICLCVRGRTVQKARKYYGMAGSTIIILTIFFSIGSD